ncbi:flavin reductase family protein [Bradyrhizobium tunisiense]|uniref:flavin reductase family protein n=1 Tax=Bradyrhizobium tunisiense TaxID=3278709 RepID=UPI0035DC13E7
MSVDAKPVDAKDFKQAMRQCAGAVALVTVGAEHGKRTGLTVTSACSLSDSPPSLIVCVNRNASAHARIREEGAFAINFLHEDHALLALTFSGQKGVNGDDRFTFGQWARGATGAPMLADAVAAFDCVLAREFETATHSIFVGEVRGVSHEEAARALVYLRSSFHTPQEMRETVTVGDIDSRHLSWTDFS